MDTKLLVRSCCDFASQATINQTPSSQSTVNLKEEVHLHPDLVLTPQVARSVQLPPIGPQILPPISQPGALLGFILTQVNHGLQGSNELLDIMYHIIHKHNSLPVEGRLLHLEESIHSVQPRGNIIQEVVSWRTQTVAPRPAVMRKDEAPKLNNHHRSKSTKVLP